MPRMSQMDLTTQQLSNVEGFSTVMEEGSKDIVEAGGMQEHLKSSSRVLQPPTLLFMCN